MPVPKRIMLDGSGTGEVAGAMVIVAGIDSK
jgi:hypothetical protein